MSGFCDGIFPLRHGCADAGDPAGAERAERDGLRRRRGAGLRRARAGLYDLSVRPARDAAGSLSRGRNGAGHRRGDAGAGAEGHVSFRRVAGRHDGACDRDRISRAGEKAGARLDLGARAAGAVPLDRALDRPRGGERPRRALSLLRREDLSPGGVPAVSRGAHHRGQNRDEGGAAAVRHLGARYRGLRRVEPSGRDPMPGARDRRV